MLKPYYETSAGQLYVGDSAALLEDARFMDRYRGNVDLVFFSPPYSLVKQKKYKNKNDEEYVEWLSDFAKPLAALLSPTGSIVIEIGNAWTSGSPTMSTAPLEALLAFKKKADLHLCQEFVWHNPARLPSPAQWVTIERSRLKDSWTKIWWLSPNERPKADNRRVLQEYSKSMKSLLRKQKYNPGLRPSEHRISETSFLSHNGGSIPSSALEDSALTSFIRLSNTRVDQEYRAYCAKHGLPQHPARMPPELAAFFIALTTEPGDVVLDPFAGSNTTGAEAERMGRRWISLEMSAEYAQGSRARFEWDLKAEEV